MKTLSNAVDKHKKLILDAEKYIWEHPETGYREFGTSEYLAERFESFGYELTKAENIPGFYTVIDTGRPGPEILVMGEMDSLINSNHKSADPKTGYVHSCGHHVQSAALLGLAAALKEPGILDDLCGRIRLCAVPAEELIEIEYRAGLREKGIIKYFGGKGEFLYRGYFDGVDMAILVHAGENFRATQGHVGCIAKTVYYKGVAAHAGICPWNGRNALYAATQGLSAANAIRETFQEADIIRFHPIITHGGDAVNAVPNLVTIESFVRGKTFKAILEANRRLNQALCGAALSMDVNIEIVDFPGYAPHKEDQNLLKVVKEAADLIIPEENFEITDFFTSGSTDMGELSGLMPVAHVYAGGANGGGHTDTYKINDPERTCVKSVKMQLATLKLLLSDNAERAKAIIAEFKPDFKSKEEYFEYIDKIFSSGNRITYNEDGTATTRIR